MKDLRDVYAVEVQVVKEGKNNSTVWVNVDGVCVTRIQVAKNVLITTTDDGIVEERAF